MPPPLFIPSPLPLLPSLPIHTRDVNSVGSGDVAAIRHHDNRHQRGIRAHAAER